MGHRKLSRFELQQLLPFSSTDVPYFVWNHLILSTSLFQSAEPIVPSTTLPFVYLSFTTALAAASKSLSPS